MKSMICFRAMPETPETALVPFREDASVALRHALRLWSEAVTAPSTERRDELLGYKRKAVESFFNFAGKPPVDVSPLDVERWRKHMEGAGPEGQGLGPST